MLPKNVFYLTLFLFLYVLLFKPTLGQVDFELFQVFGCLTQNFSRKRRDGKTFWRWKIRLPFPEEKRAFSSYKTHLHLRFVRKMHLHLRFVSTCHVRFVRKMQSNVRFIVFIFVLVFVGSIYIDIFLLRCIYICVFVGAPRLSLTKYFRDLFSRVSLTIFLGRLFRCM